VKSRIGQERMTNSNHEAVPDFTEIYECMHVCRPMYVLKALNLGREVEKKTGYTASIYHRYIAKQQ
jgi:hypothetical protein